MEYLIAQGSSIRKIFVYCAKCGKKQVWIRLFPYPDEKGHYIAECAKCRNESLKELKKI